MQDIKYSGSHHARNDYSVSQRNNFISFLVFFGEVIGLANPFYDVPPDKDGCILYLFLLAIQSCQSVNFLQVIRFQLLLNCLALYINDLRRIISTYADSATLACAMLSLRAPYFFPPRNLYSPMNLGKLLPKCNEDIAASKYCRASVNLVQGMQMPARFALDK